LLHKLQKQLRRQMIPLSCFLDRGIFILGLRIFIVD